MKVIRSLILLLTAVLLAVSCSACRRLDYTPTGEIYIKTSPANGDAGVAEVLELEIDCASHPAADDVTVPVRLGIGHLYPGRADGEAYACVILTVWLDKLPKDEPDEVRVLEYPDWETEKYVSTKPEKTPLWAYLIPFMPYYGDFYPLYRETVDVVIPADVSFGVIRAELYIVDDRGNEYRTDPLRLSFERIGGAVVFEKS